MLLKADRCVSLADGRRARLARACCWKVTKPVNIVRFSATRLLYLQTACEAQEYGLLRCDSVQPGKKFIEVPLIRR
jgi:hypothetical protein